MIFIRRFLVTVLATALICASFTADGDIGPLQMFKGSGVVAPQSPHQSIRLDSQEVVIRLERTSYVVDVVFRLFNTGETKTEWIGFPKWVASRVDSYPTFMRFDGSINGRPLKFNEEWDLSGGEILRNSFSIEEYTRLAQKPMNTERHWLVSQATFPGHERTTICVSYEAPYDGKGYREASYVYGTGSLWKGNIGKAVFIVDSSSLDSKETISTDFVRRVGSSPIPENVKSVPKQISKNKLRYEIRDFEPHPEAYFWIKVSGWLGSRPALYSPPPPQPPPLPTPVKSK
jgi:hypothetical protein